MDSRAQQILVQVSQLYQRYGIKSVTMDDVAKHLGISKKTLYEHFRDKEDLVKQVIYLDHSSWFDVLKEPGTRGLNSIEELFEIYQILKRMFRKYNPSVEYDLRKYYPDLSMKMREVRRKGIYETSYRNIVRGKNEGLYRKDLNAKVIGRLHLLMIENFVDTDMFSIEELTSLSVFNELFVYHLYGIMSPEGRHFFEASWRKFKATSDNQKD